MENVSIASIQVGMPQVYGSPDSESSMQSQWYTGFYKNPISGPIELYVLGLKGDGVADTNSHGGHDKAVLGYSLAHYSFWKSILGGDELEPGSFGENFSIVGQTESSACIGDRYKVGDCELEISQPRQPCWKLGRRLQNKMMPKWVTQTGFGGWYFRVLKTGMIERGMAMQLIKRPHPQWTISRANDVLYGRELDSASMTELMLLPELSDSWKSSLG
jgi:MOSC domain-containing protein YiiM